MLKGIPKMIPPELLKLLCEMGHGDQLVIADGNFPAASCAQRLVRMDGHGTSEVLETVLTLFPLDEAPNTSLGVMATQDGSKPDIWTDYAANCDSLTEIERFAFYELAKKAYCIIATSESALYANVLLTKGVI
jgi:L-fucose mutarotase